MDEKRENLGEVRESEVESNDGKWRDRDGNC